MRSINCKGKLIDLNSPVVMGILNLTPDSFYDGGKYKDEEGVLSQVKKMLDEGATIIDIGAYSSRPNAKHISEEEELNRIVPIVELLVKEFPEIIISIDTFRSRVAEACLEAGAAIINDISGGAMDDEMLDVVAKYDAPYILMHMKGTPQTMQKDPTYENMIKEITFYFSEKVNRAHGKGVNDIILDVGFGFGKTIAHNYELLKKMRLFDSFELPLLVGVSRKSMLYKPLGETAQTALNATTVANTLALENGASILRVHDVKEAVETIKIWELYNQHN
ncbi:dihydropteroate synthase [Aureivirga sp. CE67]|uniref:dihydropteroate synthase n=1 Tax=Aureivirga sp. CE67 TaxID=1788983 RepID=UPI0018CAA907|nr:dihydropteroate synthase [Aureivirga sp. CE67]